MTDTPSTQPLEPHEVNRLLRAFHTDVRAGDTCNFHYKSTPLKTQQFTCSMKDGHHIIEVGDNFISHTMRHNTTEISTLLQAKDSGTITLTRQRREFDFAKGELGEPVAVPIVDVMQENHDMVHMAHVVMRTRQTLQMKAQDVQRG